MNYYEDKMDKKDIMGFIRSKKNLLYNRYGVKSIGLFGSYINGHYNKNSDIDIVIEFHKDQKNLHNFLAVKRYLENNLNREVDIGIESNLKPSIKEKVKNQIIYV